MALPKEIQARFDAIHKPRPHDQHSLDVLLQCGVISTVKAIIVDFGFKPREHGILEPSPVLWYYGVIGFFLGKEAFSCLGSPWMTAPEKDPDGFIWYQTTQAMLDYIGELFTFVLKQDNAVEIINGLLAEVGKHRGCRKHDILQSIYEMGDETLPAECNPMKGEIE